MGWFDFIRRATGAKEVQFIPRPTGDFSIRVEWSGANRYVKDFTREFVFGSTFSTPSAWRVQEKTCDYARMIVREILEQRGVI
jgi:hypothetical protein